MRVLVDLQALQTHSKNRGIGRYTRDLLLALVPQLEAQGAEVAVFADAQLPAPDWPGFISFFDPGEFAKNSPESTLILETFLRAQQADWVFVPSPVDEGVTVDFSRLPTRVATICYDLIPLIFAERYLPNPTDRASYDAAIATIRTADQVFGISEATCADTVRLLHRAPSTVHNIAAGASAFFQPLSEEERAHGAEALRTEFGLEPEGFVLYTGGDEWRKNMDGLIRGFARLSVARKNALKLVIACRLRPEVIAELREVARKEGIAERLVLTNFVPDETLRTLYGLCALFTFPSRYEGFGLPIIEALGCGAAVCAADNSSLRELVTDPAHRYDPESPQSIADCLERLLADPVRLKKLRTEAPTQAAMWSWEASARRVAGVLLATTDPPPVFSVAATRLVMPSIAHVSPLPPSRSGIADYSAELLPYLHHHLPLTSFPHDGTPALERHSLIIRQLGNSEVHGQMYAELKRIAGVTVLHDYGLGSILHFISQHRPEWGVRFADELRHHGGTELASEVQAKLTSGTWQLGELGERGVFVNRRIFTRSLGVIVHSKWARSQALSDHGDLCPVTVIPHQMALPRPAEQEPAALRAKLDVPQETLLVVAPGFLAETKRSVPLLEAFAQLHTQHPQSSLVYVGSAEFFPGGSLDSEIRKRGLENAVRVTGYVPHETLEDYLRVADVGVALRYPFGGETSGSVLRLLAHGTPLIVTKIGSFAELPEDVALRICPPTQDDEIAELVTALSTLANDKAKRQAMGTAAREWIARTCAPDTCARQYAAFIAEISTLPETRQKLAADAAARTVAERGNASELLWERLRGALG
ncbi:glycosyltransferase [Armatimonas sp.]|uniref:glycosyltransferase n=1 Tax=Armatimonas sp. TaxID=1872638 RepID=UPI00286C63C4|nr:glycosyltransferase [Armatimonas sp.]